MGTDYRAKEEEERDGSRFVELGQHLLHEFIAPGSGSMSLLHRLAGELLTQD